MVNIRGIFFAFIIAIAFSAIANASPNLEQTELLMPSLAQVNAEAVTVPDNTFEAVNAQFDASVTDTASELTEINRTTKPAIELTIANSEKQVNLREVGWRRSYTL